MFVRKKQTGILETKHFWSGVDGHHQVTQQPFWGFKSLAGCVCPALSGSDTGMNPFINLQYCGLLCQQDQWAWAEPSLQILQIAPQNGPSSLSVAGSRYHMESSGVTTTAQLVVNWILHLNRYWTCASASPILVRLEGKSRVQTQCAGI